MKINVIGDVHGQCSEYLKLVEDTELSLQVGDMGFDYAHMLKLDPERHKFIPGNHDNYNIVKNCPNVLYSYGVWKEIFYVRGAFSIDAGLRVIGKSWWEQEELSYKVLREAISRYKAIRPRYVVTHDCPSSILPKIIGKSSLATHFGFNTPYLNTRTGRALQAMFEVHQPEQWVFGHHHKSKKFKVNNTQFICLNILEKYELDVGEK